MNKWKEKRLGEVCEIIDGDRGSNYPKQEEFRDDGYCLFLNTGNVTRNGFDFSSNQFISIEKDKLLRKGKLSKEDIVLTTRGTVGNVAYYNKNVPFDNIRINSGMVIIRNNEELLDVGYLYQYIKSPIAQSLIKLYSSGSAQPQLPIKDLKKIKIILPDLPVQKRIANVLSAYDDLIENNNKRIALLEKTAQELYKEWFVRFRFPGHEKSKFINGLPEGWERKKISEYYNTSSGGTPSRSNEQFYINGKYPWIKTGEVKDTIIIDTEEYITEDAVKQSSAKLIPARSVIMAMYGINIGILGYADREMTCNQACCVFADKREFSARHYLYQYLMSIREYLLLISFGAAQQNVSQDLIKKIKIVMPTNDVVIEYEKKIDTIYNSIRSLLYKNKNLIKQRDLLLPRLMSGKLEV